MTSKPQSQEPLPPARISERHVMDRHLSTSAGSKLGWRTLTVFERYAEQDDKNMLVGGDKRNNHKTRLAAGKDFASVYLRKESGSKDSTDQEHIDGGGSGYGLISNMDAKKVLAGIKLHMGRKNFRIIELVCGQEWWPSKAIPEAFGYEDYSRSIRFRFIEALDDLIEAQRATDKMLGIFADKIAEADARAEASGE